MGGLHLQTTHVVLRIIRRCKSAESLHLSLDFHFITTNLERILIIHVLGLFPVKKKIKFQQVSSFATQVHFSHQTELEADSQGKRQYQVKGGQLPKHSRGRNSVSNEKPRPRNNKYKLNKFTQKLHFLPIPAASILPLYSLIDVRIVHTTPHFHNGHYAGLKEEKKNKYL